MKPLVRKMKSFGILKMQLIASAVIMAAAMVVLPIAILMWDASLLLNPFIIGTIIVVIAIFGSFGYFLALRPYFLYRKSPDVLVETDGEYLYIHGKKEAKIPLSEIDEVYTYIHFPFIYSKEFIAVLLTHLFSENYGDLDFEIKGYGSYKLRFVSDVKNTADDLMAFINETINENINNK